MANQTAAREVNAIKNSTDMIAMPALASATYYRGAAVGLEIDGATAGQLSRLSKIFTGASMVNFIGCIPRTQPNPNWTATLANDERVAIQRGGAWLFNAVTVAGAAATPAVATWVGNPVWFVSDNEVSLTPPSQAYPICAGRVLATAASVNFDGIGATEVLVEIDHATRHPAVNWATLAFGIDLVTVDKKGDHLKVLLTFARRVMLGRTFVNTVIVPTVNSVVKVETWRGAAGTELGTVGGVAIPAAVADTAAINATYGVFDYNDALAIYVTEGDGADPLVGWLNVIVEYLPIQ